MDNHAPFLFYDVILHQSNIIVNIILDIHLIFFLKNIIIPIYYFQSRYLTTILTCPLTYGWIKQKLPHGELFRLLIVLINFRIKAFFNVLGLEFLGNQADQGHHNH